ncbi:MAG TPA: glycoside hydrolase domain-containing protein, partial [Armatimonadota bacterium]|nr:glycoside hydrolase domain-containing protein [Armatimonadota bacterium]
MSLPARFGRQAHAICCLALLTAGAPALAGGVRLLRDADGLRVWSAPCTHRVLLEDELPAEPRSEGVVLSAARNEWASVQLILRSGRDLPAVSVAAEGLLDAVVRWAEFVQVQNRSSQQAVGRDCVIADPLLPAPEHSLVAGHNQPVWITFKVPLDAEPGLREASATISAAGRPLASVPISLRVWDFALPDDCRPIILGNLWTRDEWLARYTAADPWPIWQQYLRDLREHRINAIAYPGYISGVWTEDTEPEGLDAWADRLHYALDELGFRRCRFPSVAGASAGQWAGIPIFERSRPEGCIWIFADSCAERELAPGADARWDTRGGGLGIFAPARPPAPNGSWAEYAVEVTGEDAGEYELILQVTPIQEAEAREVWWDGQRVGEFELGAAKGDPRGFLHTGCTLTLTPGAHRLRVVFTKVFGYADKLGAIILRRPTAAPVEDLELQSLALTDEFRAAYAVHLRRGMQFYRDHGWADAPQLKLWDEPAVSDYLPVRLVYRFAREVLPDAHLELSEEPSAFLADTANVWTPYMTSFNPEAVAERQQAGDEVWFYANALHGVDCPGAGIRLIPWLLWRYHLDGYLLWSVNYAMQDPWTAPSASAVDAYKRGTFIYPHPGDGGPVDTVRWEVLRDGLEDYACFELLASLADRADDPEATRAALDAEVAALAPAMDDLRLDDEAIEAARERLCGLIEQLSRRQ